MANLILTRILLTIKISWVFLLLASIDVNAQEKSLIEFSMEDQFGRHYSNTDFAGKYVYIVGSGRNGSAYGEDWGKAIYRELEARGKEAIVSVVGVADLKGAPGFLHNYILGKFPEEEAKWILLDWEGKFDKAYHFNDDEANILLFDPQGQLLYRTTGKDVIRQKIKELTSPVIKP